LSKSKEPFSDKRWSQMLGGVVVGYSEVTEEEKQQAEEFLQKILEEEDKINGKSDWLQDISRSVWKQDIP